MPQPFSFLNCHFLFKKSDAIFWTVPLVLAMCITKVNYWTSIHGSVASSYVLIFKESLLTSIHNTMMCRWFLYISFTYLIPLIHIYFFFLLCLITDIEIWNHLISATWEIGNSVWILLLVFFCIRMCFLCYYRWKV